MDTQYVLVICLLYSGIIGLAAASLCNESAFYEKDERCCEFCKPGTFVYEDCTAVSKTNCRECPENFYSDGHDRLPICSPCLKCQQDVTSKCTLTTNANCSCYRGFLCSDHYCETCEQNNCRKGEELNKAGTIKYMYTCNPCPNNTYSDTEEGSCKPLTKCEEFGYVFRGNKTHDAKCGPPGREEKPDTILLIMAICFFLLMFLTCACFWISRQKPKGRAIKCRTASVSVASQDKCGCPLSTEESVGQHIQPTESDDYRYQSSLSMKSNCIV
ncbi:hypothetical protein DPEC_G00205220 [Dallia pectoralis]|uniref:Uncharacterized protein n=1 Tax=Dallia pectoralis TaxID=75939 RepID=A0ACC2G4P8_DALPE|nr:hypothetical protein DPEC_G00205220 [Dallia pectoralis]